MAFDMSAWRKAQMQAQDAKMQTSKHAPTQQVPGGGFVPEVSALNRNQSFEVEVRDNHQSRRRRKHKLMKAMAVYAESTLR